MYLFVFFSLIFTFVISLPIRFVIIFVRLFFFVLPFGFSFSYIFQRFFFFRTSQTIPFCVGLWCFAVAMLARERFAVIVSFFVSLSCSVWIVLPNLCLWATHLNKRQISCWDTNRFEISMLRKCLNEPHVVQDFVELLGTWIEKFIFRIKLVNISIVFPCVT